ncbi:hypothetical protein CRG98_045385 [Punica granatum]|nr:hypothetical protein CRG98_045385 [Punica granatum]
MTVVYILCSNSKVDGNDLSYGASVMYVVTDVGSHTSTEGYNYYNTSPSTIAIAFGHGACNGELSRTDCDLCMNHAVWTLLQDCVQSTGGQIQLQDCRIRYENHPFVE